MWLYRITEELVKVDARQIIGIGRGNSDLIEYCVRFKVAGRVRVMLNDNVREQRDIEIEGYTIPVRDFLYINELYAEDILKDYLFVILDDYYTEVYNELKKIPCLLETNTQIYYYLSHENEIEEEYRNKYKDDKLRDIIVFRSGPHPSQYVHGMDFDDNARALFEYMLDAELNNKYELVWFVKNPAEFDRFIGVKNVRFLSFDWAHDGTKVQMDEYYRALCLAKYLFFTDAYGFARNCRKDQVRVQLWHGCGFKTRVNFTRCEHRYEFMPVISLTYKKIHERIYGLRDDQVVITGYPKEDWLFHSDIRSFGELFGVPEASRYILWLPTFREAKGELSNLNEYSIGKDTGLPVADTFEKLERLNSVLTSENMVLIVKLHPFQKRERVRCEGFSNICLIENDDLYSMDIPINRILGKADALISDYSSAAIDYLILDRPMGFLLEDIREYENSRGFVFSPIRDFIPGVELFDFDDMLCFVKEIAEGKDSSRDKRQRLRRQLHSFNDDRSCERLIKELGI